MRRVWSVMGTLLTVTVWAADTAGAGEDLAAARAQVFRVDTLMSVYKDASDLSVVNRRAGRDSATVVSAETATVLSAALRYAHATAGALDVTVGPLVDVWGFYRHEGRVPPARAVDSAAALVGYGAIRFDPASREVALPRRGMRLDFGAIAKGYAVDRAVEVLRERGVRHAMVDLGGNLRVLGTSPRGGPWSVGLRDPRAPDRIFATISLDSGAVATSGDYEQFFELNGVRYSHIFDPTTRRPARGTAAATVVAPTAMGSDALSTALYVLGWRNGCPVAARLPGVEAVWVVDPGKVAGGVGRLDPSVLVATPDALARLNLLRGDSTMAAGGHARPCPAVEH